MRCTIAVIATALSLGFSASLAVAQSRPYGGDDQLAPGAAAVHAGAPTNVYNYPAEEVRAVPPARAAAAVARAVQNREYVALNGAVRQTVRTFERSEELSKAMAEEQAAYDEYEKAREAALRDLRNDPKYQAQVELANGMKQKIAGIHAEPKLEGVEARATQTHVVALASVRMDYANAARQRETEALAKNDAVQGARRKLMDARQRVTQLRERFGDDVRSDGDIIAARKAYWDAKINRIGAEAYLRGVLESRRIALNYTYYINKYNKYGQGYQYAGGYPYDCGYGFGYTTYPYVPR